MPTCRMCRKVEPEYGVLCNGCRSAVQRHNLGRAPVERRVSPLPPRPAQEWAHPPRPARYWGYIRAWADALGLVPDGEAMPHAR